MLGRDTDGKTMEPDANPLRGPACKKDAFYGAQRRRRPTRCDRNQRPLSPLQLPGRETNRLEGGVPGVEPSRQQGGGLLSSPLPLSPLNPMQDANNTVKAGKMGPQIFFFLKKFHLALI